MERCGRGARQEGPKDKREVNLTTKLGIFLVVSNMFYFQPLGEMIQFDYTLVSNGLKPPATCKLLSFNNMSPASGFMWKLLGRSPSDHPPKRYVFHYSWLVIYKKTETHLVLLEGCSKQSTHTHPPENRKV